VRNILGINLCLFEPEFGLWASLRPSFQLGSAATFEAVMKAAKDSEMFRSNSQWGAFLFVSLSLCEQRKRYWGARLFGGQAGAKSPVHNEI
jgi:hypothetical protein